MQRFWVGVLVVAAAALSLPAQEAEPTLAAVLARAAAYVTDYQNRLAGIVAEEQYRQNVMVTQRRGSPATSEIT